MAPAAPTSTGASGACAATRHTRGGTSSDPAGPGVVSDPASRVAKPDNAHRWTDHVEPVRRRPHHPDARVVTCTGRPASHDEPDGPGHRRVAHHRPPRDVPVALLVEDVGFVLAVVVVFEIKVSEGRIRVSIQRLRLGPGASQSAHIPCRPRSSAAVICPHFAHINERGSVRIVRTEPLTCIFLVAGAGFEPATSGL